MSTQTYAKQVADIAGDIRELAQEIEEAEKARREWIKPEGARFNLGRHVYVVKKDGNVNPMLAGVQREALAVIDERLRVLNGRLEGLRFKLVQLGKTGGAA